MTKTIQAVVVGCALMGMVAEADVQGGSGTPFAASGDEEYQFDTGTLRGTLRRDGKSLGLSSIIHVPTGTKLDGGRHGIFSHYRVFTANKRYGHGAWDRPSTSMLLPDGAVQIQWPAGDDHPFELRATYRWSKENTLDLETTVAAQSDLPQFEVFLASYFDKAFPGSSVYVDAPSTSKAEPGFVTTERSSGHWQLFPRNREMVSLVQDGRWRKAPNPVDWAIRQNLAAPLAMRRAPKSGLCAILMAPPEDCFALATPYQGEGHFSLYLSLFGQTVKAGQSATARSRLIIAPSPSDEQILAMSRSYLAEVLPALEQHRTQLALLFPGGKPSDTGPDDKAVAVIKRVADMAKPFDVTVVLYPHQKHWLETSGDAVRIAKKVNRPTEVGAMFNLCHWMAADANRDLRAVLKEAQPWLKAVSLSGSDRPEQVRARKANFIQPLGKGTYDITESLRILRELDYSDPVGLQCWGIGGDAREHLAQSMETWKRVAED